MRSIGETLFVAFDTETTGLSFASRLIELAGVKFRAGDVLKTFETFVDPGEPIPPEASTVHGIRDADVRGAPGAGQALEQFEAFIEGATLLAHNAPYDLGILGTEYARSRQYPPTAQVFDTCALARALRLPVRDYKLPTLAAHFGAHPAGAHRALADSHFVQRVFAGCLRAARLGWESPMEAVEPLAAAGTIAEVIQVMENLPAHLRPLLQAMEAGAPTTIRYAGGTKGPAPRVVSPLAFYVRNGAAYMEAIAHEDATRKSFRLDRILEVCR